MTLFEKHFGKDKDLRELTRADGDEFRAWLLTLKASSKTTRDRFVWVKTLLRYAARDLEMLDKSRWEGLKIEYSTTAKRRPWTSNELGTLFSQPLFTQHQLPKNAKAGADAAYWIPLLGRYTGARLSELAQLRPSDIFKTEGFTLLRITNDGDGLHVKTEASVRNVPIHSELIRLGFLDYAVALQQQGIKTLWPNLRHRKGKPGGYFSVWFAEFRRMVGVTGKYPDFHCFRHTVRTELSRSGVSVKIQDLITGHESAGSIGEKVYTHIDIEQLVSAIESINADSALLPRART